MSSKNGTNTGLIDFKTVFITNRGGTHPNRVRYFDSIGADYQLVDFRMPWHGQNKSKLRMLLSGLVCAISFPKKSSYDLFVTSDPQLPAVLLKKLKLIKSKQKIVSYLGSQTLYFIHSRYYSRFTISFYRFLLKSYDYHICNGNLQAEFLQEVADIDPKKIYVNYNGISIEKVNRLQKIRYNFDSKTVLFIGNIYSDWRIHYKGLDLAIEAITELFNKHRDLKFIIAGAYDKSLSDLIAVKVPSKFHSRIELAGKIEDVSQVISQSCLYVHASRGDALPNSLLEAMYSGIPSVVSNLTGNHELVSEMDPKLVVDIEKNQLINAIDYFLELPTETKKRYSKKAKELTKDLSQESAINTFQNIMKNIAAN